MTKVNLESSTREYSYSNIPSWSDEQTIERSRRREKHGIAYVARTNKELTQAECQQQRGSAEAFGFCEKRIHESSRIAHISSSPIIRSRGCAGWLYGHCNSSNTTERPVESLQFAQELARHIFWANASPAKKHARRRNSWSDKKLQTGTGRLRSSK